MLYRLLILIILVWPFGQLLQLTPIGQVTRLQLLDILVALLSLYLLLRSINRRKIRTDPLLKPLVLFLLTASFSLLLAFFRGAASLNALLYLLRFGAYTSVYFAVRLTEHKKLKNPLIFSAALFIGFGLLQYIVMPDMRFLKNLGFDDHYYRLVGSLLDPNFTGLVLSVLALLVLALGRGKSRLLALVPLTALVLTFSRASFSAFSASLLYLIITKRQLKLLVLFVFLILVLYLVPKPFGEGVNLLRTFSITSRVENQAAALKIFLAHPIIGVGFNTLSTGVDNSFLFVLATTGLLGFSAFVYFLKNVWVISRSNAARAGLIAIFVHSLFNNSFFYTWVLCLFFVLIGHSSKRQL